VPRECPDEPELLAFHLGTLADEQIEQVAAHLESCADCEAAIQRVEADADGLLEGLRLSRASHADAFDLLAEGRPRRASAPDWGEQPALPGFEILERLGRGGMGVVYKARQIALNRVVALKRLRSTGRREAARARVEAEALGRLQHPYIVQIHEVLEHEERVYLALEFVAGGSLQARLNGKPQPCEPAARLIELVARGVHHAHLNDIVHRDLKPANILLAHGEQEAEPRGETRTASYGLPKIADFGVAKWLAGDSGETELGDVLGTAAYMAPEQAAGNLALVGPASDTYSLGVVLYEMLTGRVPLQGTTTLETLALVRSEEPVSPRLLQPHIPRDLETICLKCLEKEPASRYRTAADLADDLSRFLKHQPILARPIPFWERGFKWARRHPAVAALSAALVLAVVLGVAGISWEWRRAEEQAAAEFVARKKAEENERKVERLSARMMLDRAAAQCESGDISRGLLWMIEALEASERAGDDDLARVARMNLAAWRPFLLRERARCSPSGVTALAFDPGGKTLLAGGPDGQARRWDSLAGGSAGPPLQHEGPIYALAYSSESRLIVSGSGTADN
jgi:serine/threonine protein kinase